jgi:hypothetical protein
MVPRGRLAAEKKQSGRGAHSAWVISHAELERFQREGLRRRSDVFDATASEKSSSP